MPQRVIEGDFGGAAVFCNNSSPSLVNCVLRDNQAPFGGAVELAYSAVLLANCLIINNVANLDGGGVYSGPNSAPTIANCTLSGNTAGTDGGGVFCYLSDALLANCVLWDDGPNEIYVHSGSADVRYCDVQGGWPGDGNIDADPLFADTAAGNFRLAAGSPCIDAGDNTALSADMWDIDGDGDPNEPLPFDLAGNPRFVDDPATEDTGLGTPPIVDMGAYEFAGPAACPGDSNCSGYVDWRDIDFFVAAQNDSVSAWHALHVQVYGAPPSCPFANNDVDQNGFVNWHDIDPFVTVQNTTCP